MKSKLNLVLYAAAAFVVFMALTWVLKLAGGKLPVEDGILGVYRDSDFLLGIVVALIVTLSHVQKRKLRK